MNKWHSTKSSILKYKNSSPQIADNSFIADGVRILGDVKISEKCSIWFNAVLRADINSIEIGEGTNIQDNAVIHVATGKNATKIGKNCTIGHLAMVHACTVGDNCLIGMQSIILDGAVIGEESIVGAGAVVTGNVNIPPRSLVLGAPAKVIRQLKDNEIESLSKSAYDYWECAKNYELN